MRDSLRKLVDLWRVDDALAGVEAELAELPERRAAGEREVAAAEVAATDARAVLQACEREQRDAEGRLAEAQASIQRLKAEQATTKNNARYRAIDDVDIPLIKQACGEIETKILEASYAADDARAALAAAEGAARGASKRVAELLARLDARAGELAKELERLRAARAELAPHVEPELRAHYERVAARRRPALALVSGGVCTGCRVGVPAQSLSDLFSGERVVACESCRRILIHESLLHATG